MVQTTPSTAIAETALVEMRGITKRFGSLIACDSVDLRVRKGTLHAVMGENGAGKTTLLRVLYGYYQPDAGEIYLQGKRVHFRSPADAIAHHIGMVSQHYSIIPELTILDNLILGAEPTRFAGLLNRKHALERAQQLAQALEFDPEWNRPAELLSVAGRQKLEILKLLWRNAEILILDEPTAMLSPTDVETLFAVLKRLQSEGRTIILVTHKLGEALQYADVVTVMREGRKVADAVVAEVNAETLTRWIIGEGNGQSAVGNMEGSGQGTVGTSKRNSSLSTPHSPSIRNPESTPRLTIQDLSVRADRGGWAVQGLNLTVMPGEMMGIAGVDGNGQTELMEALAGLRPIAKGTLLLDGEPFTHRSTAWRIQKGIRYLFDDRFRRGMIPQWSVLENAILGAQRDPKLQRFGWLNRQAIIRRARTLIQQFQVKAPSLYAPMLQLSGGNQQRLVIARTLYGQPRIVIAYAPTRGLDIRGTSATYEALRSGCREGMSALVLSLDLDELMEYADRIAVLYKGQIVRVFERAEFSRSAIGSAMVGITPP